MLEEYYSEVEQIFIKNIFQRIDYINSNVEHTYEKEILTDLLLDYLTYHFPNWQENVYLSSNFKDFEIIDIYSAIKNKKYIKEYTPTTYAKEKDIFKKYDTVSRVISPKKRTRSLW